MTAFKLIDAHNADADCEFINKSDFMGGTERTVWTN